MIVSGQPTTRRQASSSTTMKTDPNRRSQTVR